MGTASLASQRGEGIRFPSLLLGVRKAASSLRAQSSTNMKNSESSGSRSSGQRPRQPKKDRYRDMAKTLGFEGHIA